MKVFSLKKWSEKAERGFRRVKDMKARRTRVSAWSLIVNDELTRELARIENQKKTD
jgi:hypothetical protein